jgi:hypothetical protein
MNPLVVYLVPNLRELAGFLTFFLKGEFLERLIVFSGCPSCGASASLPKR